MRLCVIFYVIISTTYNAQAEIACEARSFTEFFAALVENPHSVERYIASDAFYKYTDAVSETQPVQKSKVLDKTKAVRYFGSIRNNGLEYSITDYTVKACRNDTDYQFNMIFKKIGNCWELYGIIDDSL